MSRFFQEAALFIMLIFNRIGDLAKTGRLGKRPLITELVGEGVAPACGNKKGDSCESPFLRVINK